MIPDPRIFSKINSSSDPLLILARDSLSVPIPTHQEKLDQVLRDEIQTILNDSANPRLAAAMRSAPVDLARHLWRRTAEVFTQGAPDSLGLRVFALPIALIVQGSEPSSASPILTDVSALSAILQGSEALGGNRSFGLGETLAGASLLDFDRIGQLYGWQALSKESGLPISKSIESAPIEILPGQENVHLRFILGAALAGPGVRLFESPGLVGKWGVPFAKELSRQLGQSGLTLLALPRAPTSPPVAFVMGRRAQREVSLELFVSNAVRQFRATVGEPAAVLAAHRAPEAAGGGELRLSLSSPFSPLGRESAEGFRCPLHALDRVTEVERFIVSLLQDCRISEVHVLDQIFPDLDPSTHRRLFLRPETLRENTSLVLQ